MEVAKKFVLSSIDLQSYWYKSCLYFKDFLTINIISFKEKANGKT